MDALLAQVGKEPCSACAACGEMAPAFGGDMDIVIRADGSWWHEA